MCIKKLPIELYNYVFEFIEYPKMGRDLMNNIHNYYHNKLIDLWFVDLHEPELFEFSFANFYTEWLGYSAEYIDLARVFYIHIRDNFYTHKYYANKSGLYNREIMYHKILVNCELSTHIKN